MQKPRWHHKLDSNAWHEPNLRNVFFGDVSIGRVYCEGFGPSKDVWKWTGRWGGLVDGKPLTNSGRTESMETALEELRQAALDLGRQHPDQMLWVIDSDPYGRGRADEMLSIMLGVPNGRK